MPLDATQLADFVFESVEGYLRRSLLPLIDRLAVVEARQPEHGLDGKSVDPEEVRRLVDDQVASAVAEIPPAEPGKDADPELIAEMVAAEVAKLPPAEPGKPVDPEEVRELVAAEVEQAVKSLPVPADGHTPTAEELAPLVETAVTRAVSELPKPKDGEPGPPGQDGKSIDTAEIADIVRLAFGDIKMPEIAAPDDVAPTIGKAIALLAESPPVPEWKAQPQPMIITVPPHERCARNAASE
jgi:hypothetical protein